MPAMTRRGAQPHTLIPILVGSLLAACGGGDSSGATPESTAAATTIPATTTAPSTTAAPTTTSSTTSTTTSVPDGVAVTLAAHLASWGVVVASPDHPSRDLRNVLGATASGDPAESVAELLAARVLMSETGPLTGMIDLDGPWAAIGHSAGGSTVARLAADPGATGLRVIGRRAPR
jgi:hypothetical protein